MKKKFFKFVILCLSLVGLYDVVTCSVMLYPEKKMQSLLQYTGPITEEEMQSFLPTWEDFMDKYSEDVGFSALSFDNQPPSKVLPKEMVKWLNKKNWDVDRFFYVEQRLYDAIDAVYLKRHAQDVIGVLEESLKSEKNAASRENMQNIIASQEKFLASRIMNSEEFKMVEKNFSEIQKVLDR